MNGDLVCIDGATRGVVSVFLVLAALVLIQLEM